MNLEGAMREGSWGEAVTELVDAVVAAFVRFWKQDIVQVGLAIGMFLALAVPILLVILILWYLDSTGWRPASGFYKIGSADGLTAGTMASWLGLAVGGRCAPPLSPRAPEAAPPA